MRWLVCLAVLFSACGRSTSAKEAYERKNEALLDEYSRAGEASTASSRYGTKHKWGLTTTRSYVIRSERVPSQLADRVDARLRGRGWMCSDAPSADPTYVGKQCLRNSKVLTIGFRVRDDHHALVELSADWNDRTAQFNDD
jgi:hypothetical protein